ncbi:MAG: protein kinase [Acidobacteria bacterium]|nr:protein kinase [Acidobacteriota bacterium]
MTPERWKQISHIFQIALTLPDGNWKGYLDQECGQDSDLKLQVQNLLDAFYQPSHVLDSPALQITGHLTASDTIELFPGQVVGSFRIRQLVGSGGMGEVYLAEDTRLRRKVALKILSSKLTRDKEFVRRFRREAQIISTFNHPNIVTVYEFGESDTLHFIATEYIEGETLRKRMTSSPRALDQMLDVIIQAGAALAAAHKGNIVHRDIKPENIMLRTDGLVKVLDFGLAKSTSGFMGHSPTDETGTTPSTISTIVTTPGMLIGTIHYMSPEQVRGLQVDARSDIWSFGVVLYEMLTGRLPFAGETPSDIIAAILKSEPEIPVDQSTDIPAWIWPILRKTLAKEADKRYQTIEAVLEDLQSAPLSHEPKLEGEGHLPSPQKTLHDQPPFKNEKPQNLWLTTRRFFARDVLPQTTLLLLVAGLATCGILIGNRGSWFFESPPRVQPNQLPLFNQMTVRGLTTSGNIADTAISPDGQFVAYVTRQKVGQTIHLRHMSTNTDTELIQASDADLRNLNFSRDGTALYYVGYKNHFGTLNRINLPGGTVQTIASEIFSGVGFSPDGTRIAFIRSNIDTGSDQSSPYESLVVTDINGSHEHHIATSSPTSFFYEKINLAWSPDGTEVACITSEIQGDTQYQTLVAIHITTGLRRKLVNYPWGELFGVVWLSDGTLIVSANEQSQTQASPTQLWLVAADGTVERITNDLNTYSSLGATASGNMLVAVEQKRLSNLWTVPMADLSQARQVLPASGIESVDLMPEAIVYTLLDSGNYDIWIMDAEGKNQKQLTENQGLNYTPVITPDGRTIVFGSNRSGSSNLWRMDIDGGNVKQLTHGSKYIWEHVVSFDSKWVYFNQFDGKIPTIWKVALDGGPPIQVTFEPSVNVKTSRRDGTIAFQKFAYQPSQTRKVVIMPPDGSLAKTVELPATALSLLNLHFTPDGRSLAFLDNRDDGGNVWVLPLDGMSKARPLTHFQTEKIFFFDWSSDGKNLILLRGTQMNNVVLLSKS